MSLDLSWPSVKSKSFSGALRMSLASVRAPGAIFLMGVDCPWANGVCLSFEEGLAGLWDDEVL